MVIANPHHNLTSFCVVCLILSSLVSLVLRWCFGKYFLAFFVLCCLNLISSWLCVVFVCVVLSNPNPNPSPNPNPNPNSEPNSNSNPNLNPRSEKRSPESKHGDLFRPLSLASCFYLNNVCLSLLSHGIYIYISCHWHHILRFPSFVFRLLSFVLLSSVFCLKDYAFVSAFCVCGFFRRLFVLCLFRMPLDFILSLSCLVLSCLVLSCLVLSCLVLSCLVFFLSCLCLVFVLSCLGLSRFSPV